MRRRTPRSTRADTLLPYTAVVRAAAGVGLRRQLEGEREAVGVAGLRQQRVGLPRIIGIVVRKIDISRMQRREMAADRRAVAEHGAVDHRPLVDRKSGG